MRRRYREFAALHRATGRALAALTPPPPPLPPLPGGTLSKALRGGAARRSALDAIARDLARARAALLLDDPAAVARLDSFVGCRADDPGADATDAMDSRESVLSATGSEDGGPTTTRLSTTTHSSAIDVAADVAAESRALRADVAALTARILSLEQAAELGRALACARALHFAIVSAAHASALGALGAALLCALALARRLAPAAARRLVEIALSASRGVAALVCGGLLLLLRGPLVRAMRGARDAASRAARHACVVAMAITVLAIYAMERHLGFIPGYSGRATRATADEIGARLVVALVQRLRGLWVKSAQVGDALALGREGRGAG